MVYYPSAFLRLEFPLYDIQQEKVKIKNLTPAIPKQEPYSLFVYFHFLNIVETRKNITKRIPRVLLKQQVILCCLSDYIYISSCHSIEFIFFGSSLFSLCRVFIHTDVLSHLPRYLKREYMIWLPLLQCPRFQVIVSKRSSVWMN